MLDGLTRRRARLPHWDVEDGVYFVTSCLEGNPFLPRAELDLHHYRDGHLEARPKPDELADDEWEIRKE